MSVTDQSYECAICGYKSSNRAEFVEFRDSVKLPKVVEKARAKGRVIKQEDVKYICINCSMEMYQEDTKPPRSYRIVCPRSGEVVEVWL